MTMVRAGYDTTRVLVVDHLVLTDTVGALVVRHQTRALGVSTTSPPTTPRAEHPKSR